MQEGEKPLTPEEEKTLISSLLKKESDVIRAGIESGKNTSAAVREARRQRTQVAVEKKITKSGGDD